MVCACLVFGGLLAALVVALIAYVSHLQRYWDRRGVFTPPFAFLLGHFSSVLYKKKSIAHAVQDIYISVKENGHKYGGMYQFTSPILFIADPELLRDITVKYFDSFMDRKTLTDDKADLLFNRSILSLQGDEWRDMRHHISPAFTGSKLRGMVELISQTGFEFTRFLVNRPNYDEPLDVREAFRRLGTDVISTTAFGTPSDCVNNPDSEFYRHGSHLMEPGGLRGLLLVGYLLVPKLMKFFSIPFTPRKMTTFFTNIIEENIKYRESENKSRPDLIQLLLDARKAKESKDKSKENGEKGNEEDENETKTSSITNEDIAAQAFTFFLGGFESVATVLSFCSLELSVNPEIQDRLRAEVDAAISRNNDQLTYDVIQDLKYMDMVISEVLRKYPPAAIVNRVCNKSIDLSEEYGIKFEKGSEVILPYYPLHHDPEYYPEPERFDPERFSEANKQNIKPFTYVPFGIGPRNCVAMRFALLEVKLCMANILATTELQVCEKTQIPIKLSASFSQLVPEGGFWLTVRPRDFPSLKDSESKGPVDI